MAAKKRAKYSEWIRSTVFRDQALPRVAARGRLPELLARARALQRYDAWDYAVFMKQGRLLADYEDDYEYHGAPVHYYPTYQSLPDDELRGYFSWRTKARQGEFPPVPLCFIFLYVYELINQIGVATPLEGLKKLAEITDRYGPGERNLLKYLGVWLTDYVVYYNLDASFLADSEQAIIDRSLAALDGIQAEPREKIIEALNQICPGRLERSKFHSAHQEDMEAVIYRVLLRVSEHYGKGHKRSMVEQYFGALKNQHYQIFGGAIFTNPLKRREYEYKLDDQCVYQCSNGVWFVYRRVISTRSIRKLADLLKTIDSLMREAYGFRHPVKAEVSTKWVLRAIQEEIQAFLAEKRSLDKRMVKIDFSRLGQIREDAESTRDKLLVDAETDSRGGIPPVAPEPGPGGASGNASLSPVEYRLLHCLLYGGDRGWLKEEGQILSVLVDSINEKLYDMFADSVLDDTPELVEDYIDGLKEIVRPRQ